MTPENRSLTVKLAAQADVFARDLSKAMGSWDGFLKNIMGGKNAFLVAGGAIVGVAAAAFGLAKNAANVGDELLTLSEKTGISVEELSALKFVAEQSDTNIETLANGLKFLGKNMVDASDQNSQAAKGFRALQVETKNTDGSLRPLNDVLFDVADRFSEMQDPALKTKLAMELFGKSGTELIPMLNQGGAGIEALMEKAEELGLVMSTETAKAGDEFNNSLNALWSSVKALGVSVGGELLGPLTVTMDFITAVAVPVIKGLGGIISTMISIVLEFAAGLSAVYLAATKLTDALGITESASKGAYEVMEKLHKSSNEWANKADKAFTSIFTGSDKSDKSLKKLGDTKEKHTKITDKQVQAELESGDAKEKEKKKTEAVNKVLTELEKQRKKNTMAAEDMGEAFDANAAEAETLKKAIDGLIDAGLEPGSRAVQILRDKLKLIEESRTTQAIRDLNVQIANLEPVADDSAEAVKLLNQQISDIWNSADPAEKSMDDLNKELEIAQKLSLALGDEFDLTGAKTDLIRGKIEQLVKDGVDPAGQQIQKLQGDLRALKIDGAFHVQEFSDFAVDEFIKVKDAIETNLSGALADAIMGEDVDWEKLWKEGVLKMMLEDMIKYLISVAIAATGVKAAIAGIFGVDVTTGAAGAAAGAGGAGGAGAGAAAGAGGASAYWASAGAAAVPYAIALAATYAIVQSGLADLYEDAALSVMNPIKKFTDNLFGGGVDPNQGPREFAHGGLVAAPTLAMIGEAGPEAVIPLSRLNSVLGGMGGGNSFNFSFPNISSLENLTVGQAEQLLKKVFSQAAENLDRRGYRWPMQPRQA